MNIPFKEKPFQAKLLLTIIYCVGVAGMTIRPELFAHLTPFNLLLSAALLFYFHEQKDAQLFRFCLFVFVAGFAIELMGVNTGKIFGEYHYGEALGFKINAVPLIIGINWLLLTYCTGIISNKYSADIFVRSLIGALLMVLLDLLLEPVAMKHDFWHWQDDIIPIKNYVAWFGFSFFFNLLFQYFSFQKQNPLAEFLFVIQLLFFLVLNLLNHFIQ